MAYNLLQLQDLTRRAGWSENLVEKASAVWMYESGGNPNAHNPRGEDSWGLCQVNYPFHREFDKARLVDPVYNLQACWKIYNKEGWNAWYNSNKKYNSNYQGIAAQARAVYAANRQNPANVLDYTSIQAMRNPTPASSTNYAPVIIAALVVGFLVTR